jgi:hypothetical protein
MVIHDSPDLADNDFFPDVRFNLDDIYDFIIVRDALAHFCHPGIRDDASSRFDNFSYNPQADPFFYGLEVLSGFSSDPYEKFYLLALKNGWHVGPVGGQDNHRGNYGNRTDADGNINLTGVLLDTLNREKLSDAFQNRRTYAFQTSPPADRIFLTEFTADGHWMGEEFDNDDNILNFTLSAHAQGKFVSAQLYKNGFLLKRSVPNSNDFTWTTSDSASLGSTYYFVKLIQEDQDELWSSPIWVNSTGVHQPPETVVTPISEIRENLESGLPAQLGWTNVTVRGIVTVANQFADAGDNRGPGYLQDSTGGVAVFGESFVKKAIPGVPLEFEVTGVVRFFNGLTEIRPYAVKRTGVGSFPEPVQVGTGRLAASGELFEGLLVQISDATIIGSIPLSGNANLTIDDGSGPVALRIDKDTNIPGMATPSGKVHVTGVVGQFDTALPYHSGYQVLPRSTADIEITTAVDAAEMSEIPREFSLAQNYPNPFNGKTVISFSVPSQTRLSLKVFGLDGRLIRTLLDDEVPLGEHRFIWDSRNNSGDKVGSGIYFYRLVRLNFSKTKKMVIVE